MTGPTITVLPDPESCAKAAAEHIATAIAAAATARGVAHWATTGGSTPAAIYRHLAQPPLRDEVPWDRVQLWWGDDRFVPADHPLSNVHVATSDLLAGTAGVPIPAGNVHPIPMTAAIGQGEGPDWAAEQYTRELAAVGPPFEDGVPEFDLLLLGVGPDGHTMSVFPDSETFDRDEPALGVLAPSHVEPHIARVTLNPRVVGAARDVVVVVHGASKAKIVATVMGSERDERRWPAQLALRHGATWILDEAAAAAASMT